MARKAVPNNPKEVEKMIYVGIDIAKETHVAAAMNTDGVIAINPFSFTNNHEGFKLLRSKLETLKRRCSCRIGINCSLR